ncbi:MAG: polysaccharide biosynthesis C-terminal domain-containing protein [Lachnospiraceae bacterium]|nr:polysaccharide biosynthesis C-terminal domain-containing protein [Lachnospiraceae bacterium]
MIRFGTRGTDATNAVRAVRTARTYATYILLAAPFMTASFTMNNIIRYEGRASYAMVGLMAGGLLNIFGDWFLMEICHMGIAGAGISTAVSQFISFCILLYMFISGKTQCRLSIHRCLECREEKELLAISKTGFSSMVRQGMSSISTMLLNGRQLCTVMLQLLLCPL